MARTLIGTCSWTDRTLIESGRFYPPSAKTAEARLRFYSSHFSIVEVDSSYYALPSQRTAALWVSRTPQDFVFDIKAFGLFTNHPVPLSALPRDIREELPDEAREKGRLYYRHVPEELRDDLWLRYREAIRPMHEAGKLGVVVFQFPPWFHPGRESLDHILMCQEKLPEYRLAVEFRNAGWLSEGTHDATFDFLRQRGLAFVCVDAPQGFRSSVPPVAEVTSSIALVRFHGRNAETWEKPGLTVSERFDYYYQEEDVRQWLPRIAYLQERAAEVHLLVNTNRGDQGIVNARLIASMLANEQSAMPSGG